MISDFEPRLQCFAEVIVRVGLNLQPGQRLLVAEPYELQGVARSAESVIAAVSAAAGCEIEVIWGGAARLREFAEKRDARGFAHLVAANAARLQQVVHRGDALLILQGAHPGLFAGLAPEAVADLRRIGWEYFGPIAQQLAAGATNWTIAPAPSAEWAGFAYGDLPAADRLPALWTDVFAALRIPAPGGSAAGSGGSSGHARADSALMAWDAHLAALTRRRDRLNAARLSQLRFCGGGTDLTVGLPAQHAWCTARLATKSGVPFVANLPTEEIFTAPHKDSASGRVRVARAINHGGTIIDGIELKFARGQVVDASARAGADLLRRLLETDEGAGRLGEVALVETNRAETPPAPNAGAARRHFCHSLLDENTSHHIALGESYGFCMAAADPLALNRSLIHVDLPLDANFLPTTVAAP
jgi:aminopeptidase